MAFVGARLSSIFLNQEDGSTLNSAARSFLAGSGAHFFSLPGNAQVITDCGFVFRVPDDYVGEGVFRIVTTTDTGSGNVKLFLAVGVKDLGTDFAATNETLSATFASTTAYNMQRTSNLVPATAIAAKNLITLRVRREAGDAADTFTGTCYVAGIEFQYQEG